VRRLTRCWAPAVVAPPEPAVPLEVVPDEQASATTRELQTASKARKADESEGGHAREWQASPATLRPPGTRSATERSHAEEDDEKVSSKVKAATRRRAQYNSHLAEYQRTAGRRRSRSQSRESTGHQRGCRAAQKPKDAASAARLARASPAPRAAPPRIASPRAASPPPSRIGLTSPSASLVKTSQRIGIVRASASTRGRNRCADRGRGTDRSGPGIVGFVRQGVRVRIVDQLAVAGHDLARHRSRAAHARALPSDWPRGNARRAWSQSWERSTLWVGAKKDRARLDSARWAKASVRIPFS